VSKKKTIKKKAVKKANPNKMNPKVRKLWLDALESGKFKQVKGTLCQRSADGKSISYCCLGVLTYLHAKHVLNKTISQAFRDGDYHSLADDEKLDFNTTTTLPKEVIKWAGLNNDNPYTNYVKEPEIENPATCADLNDEHQFSFKKIAAIIRKSF
jgi:hypothetical protein